LKEKSTLFDDLKKANDASIQELNDKSEKYLEKIGDLKSKLSQTTKEKTELEAKYKSECD
jgi:phage shock protein A